MVQGAIDINADIWVVPNLSIDGGCAITMNNGHNDGDHSKGFCCLNEVMRSCVAGVWSETLGLVQVWVKCGQGQPGLYLCAQNG
jgi:hypothetical protein